MGKGGGGEEADSIRDSEVARGPVRPHLRMLRLQILILLKYEYKYTSFFSYVYNAVGRVPQGAFEQERPLFGNALSLGGVTGPKPS